MKTVLDRLKTISRRIRALSKERDQLIEQALNEGYSERVIGAAADMSGPAIHQRKDKLK